MPIPNIRANPYRIARPSTAPRAVRYGGRPVDPRLLQVSRYVDALALAPNTLRSRSPFRPQPLAPQCVREVPAGRPQRSARIQALLNEVAVPYAGHWSGIAVHVEESPGFGHYAAAVEVVEELRQRQHFHGRLYITVDCPETVSILQALHAFDDNVRFALQASIQRVQLLIVPAFDEGASRDNIQTLFEDRADMAVVLQPFTWNDDRWTQVLEQEEQVSLAVDHEAVAYQPARAQYDHIGQWFAQEMGLSPVAALTHPAVPTLSLIVNAVAHGKIDTSAVYGQHARATLRPWVEALWHAQRDSVSPTRGTVVFWLNENPPPPLPEGVPCHAISSCGMRQAVRLLAGGLKGIVVWHVGRVSTRLFRELLAQCTLPPVSEGRNASNEARILQRPYVSAFDDLHEPLHHPEHGSAFLLRYRGWQGLRNVGLALGDRVGRELVARTRPNQLLIRHFLRQARRPGSSVALGYARAGRQNRLPSSDQLRVGLGQVVDHAEAMGFATLSQPHPH